MMKRSIVLGVLSLTAASVQVLADQQQLPQNRAAKQQMRTAINNTGNPNTAANIMPPSTTTSVTPLQLSKKLDLNDSRVHINGFLSAGSTHATSSIPYDITQHGHVKDTMNFNALSLVGLQVAADLSERYSVAAQLVSNGDDTNGNTAYSVNADYAYIRTKINPNLQLRAGRVRIPTFLYSETLEVGYSYPWVFLPNEVYRIVPFNNLNGIDMLYKKNIGSSGWYTSVEPYFGANKSQFDLYTNCTGATGACAALNTLSGGNQGITVRFNENTLYGVVANMGNSYFTLRATYAHLKLSQDELRIDQKNDYYYAGAVKINYRGLLAVGEYAHRNTPTPLANLTGYYGTLGYRIRNVMPNLTYAHIKTTNKSDLVAGTPTEMAQDQESYTFGVSYYATGNYMLKAAVSQIRPLAGTRGLFDPVGTFANTAASISGLKKHIYLYSVSVNAVF